MRRIVICLALAIAGLAVVASPALATFHLNMVNEVMLSSASGDSGTQFVEFLDQGGSEEQFTPVFAPYKLIVYDAAGNQLGEQTLDPNGLRAAAAAGTEYLVSTPAVDATFGVTGNERLTVPLPAGAGQVCFAGNEPAPKPVSCMTYGTITHQVATNSEGTGTVHGPVPPNGQSDQRLSSGKVVAAPPTPKKPNRAAPGGTTAGKPTESHLSLSGVAKRKARLSFTAGAGAHAPALKKITIRLPSGLRFDGRRLISGLRVLGAGGRRLKFSAHASKGTLGITLSRPARSTAVTVAGGAIAVSKALAKKVSSHQVKHLTIELTLVDSAGRANTISRTIKVH